MTTQRRAPARKTAPRKTAPRKTVEQKISAFDDLRARAGDRTLGVAPAVPPFEIAGFNPPLIIEWPESLAEKVTLDVCERQGDIVGFLFALLGSQRLALVLAAFNSEPDPERLLIGLQIKIRDHFLGRGAGDVPGGTPASSTS